MSLEDPYHAVQHEIQTSLATAGQLQSSYRRIRNMAKDDSEELSWARSELRGTLAALEADLEALEESVNIVESTGASRFGLNAAEVQKRRKYVTQVRTEIENMRNDLSSSGPSQSLVHHPLASNVSTPTGHGWNGAPSPAQDDGQAAWSREEQQMMMREQDQTIDSIQGTLSNIAQQANLMGQEIVEHNEMLDDLERGVDRTQDKVSDGMRRLRKFLRDSEEKGSGYCVIFLVIVLMALLLAVILV
ncbi:t-SNARE [Coprinopsis sp. MPI-PUGE-AT-0042]|nr:t-SNARE [Coprinopsis sp. MPI-PUGE-AT-0042]